MDPLSIAASSAALEGLHKLLSRCKTLSEAPDKIEALKCELSVSRTILESLRRCQVYDFGRAVLAVDDQYLEQCEKYIARVESHLAKIVRDEGSPYRSRNSVRIAKIRWVLSAGELERSTSHLRDVMRTLSLHLTCLQISSTQAQLALARRDSGLTLAFCPPVIDEAAPEIESSGLKPTIIPTSEPKAHLNSLTAQCRPAYLHTALAAKTDTVSDTWSVQTRRRPADDNQQIIPNVYQICFGLLGSILLSYWKNGTLNECNSTCTGKCYCRQYSIALIYYLPAWFLHVALGVAFIPAPSLSVRFFFPAVLSPQSHVVVCVRENDYNTLKEILTQDASLVWHAVAPYSHTLLSLALHRGHKASIEILTAAHAPLYPAVNFFSPEGIFAHFEEHSLFRDRISAGELIKDLTFISVDEAQVADTLQQYTAAKDLDRLRKAILGLTQESVEVALAVSSDTEVKMHDDWGRTALHLASYMRDESTVRLLLLRGAPVDMPDHVGRSALHIAASIGELDVCSTLLHFGAESDTRDVYGYTALHHASMRGHVQVIDLLLSWGADIDIENPLGEPPLSAAVYANQPGAVLRLIEWGGDILSQDRWGYNQLLNAVFLDAREVLNVLLDFDGCGHEAMLHNGRTVLHVAALNANQATISTLERRLKTLDVEVAAQDMSGNTALEYAVRREDWDQIQTSFTSLLATAAGSANAS